VQTPLLTWSVDLIYDRNENTLVKLGDGVLPDKVQGIVEGYPVRGRWSRPVLGYSDANANGVLERSEIKLGDSLVYMGRLDPAYQTSLNTNLTLFDGAIGITANFGYQSGATQVDSTSIRNWVLSPALVDPNTPRADQAAVLALDSTAYGMTQDVSTFRFNSLSVNYRAPGSVARLLRARMLTIGVVGGNLGLHSTYRGKDPDVSAWSPGGAIRDTGQLPLPRTWQMSLSLQY
jgi:hypothetical protein